MSKEEASKKFAHAIFLMQDGSVSLSVFGGMMCISTHTPLPRGTRITPHAAQCVFPPS